MHDRLVDVPALVALRAERDWTMIELARRSGVSLSLIRKVHAGKRGLGDLTAAKIARALDCGIEAFSNPKARTPQQQDAA